jgi:glyoxylase-like metal-dependent hydrolase (beta-lactamase superfamily II)
MRAVPPRADELEVSIFGPGYGECILVHLGRGQWMIVDSCRDQRNRRQPAIKYLERIGCDPSEVVRVVVATHWHNDLPRSAGPDGKDRPFATD